jgi:superfamily I DNA/RNA helicase
MAAAKSASELKALQARVADLEKQLRELKARLDAQTQPWLDRPHTEEEAEAIHRANQRVNKIIQQYREADRRKAAADYDRLHGKTKKAAGKRQPTEAGPSARRAG